VAVPEEKVMRSLLLASALILPCAAHAQQTVVVAGYDFGPQWVASTTGAAHAAGGLVVGPMGSANQSGLIKIPIARGGPTPPAGTNYGYSGIITQFAWKSGGGSTVQLLIRLWSKLPASTTCKDGTNFAGNATDDLFLLGIPFTITPAAPASTQGDATTYASVTGLTLDWYNQDLPQTNFVYACAVITAADTADNNNTVYAMASGPQN
jgi:hypothetical protein